MKDWRQNNPLHLLISSSVNAENGKVGKKIVGVLSQTDGGDDKDRKLNQGNVIAVQLLPSWPLP